MHEMANRYLEDLRHELQRLPADDRDDAVREIGSHIADAEAAGRPLAAVLSQLGTAKALARAYIADAYLQASNVRPRGVALTRVAVFVAGSGFLSIIVVPLLAVVALTFGLTAIATPVVGVLQTLGFIADSNGVMYWGAPVAKVWVLPLTLAVSLVCAGIGWGAWRLLRSYALRILAGYQRVRAALVG